MTDDHDGAATMASLKTTAAARGLHVTPSGDGVPSTYDAEGVVTAWLYSRGRKMGRAEYDSLVDFVREANEAGVRAGRADAIAACADVGEEIAEGRSDDYDSGYVDAALDCVGAVRALG